MADGDSSAASKVNTELIVSGFSKLRQEQGTLSEKLAELEADLNEHKYFYREKDAVFFFYNFTFFVWRFSINLGLLSSVFLVSLVLQMLEKLEPERKCFRRVGGALVEKTVKEVKPSISTTQGQVSLRLIDWLIGWLVDRSVGWSILCIYQTQSKDKKCVSVKRRKIKRLVFRQQKVIISWNGRPPSYVLASAGWFIY